MNFISTFFAVTLGVILGSIILDNLPMHWRRWRKPKLPAITKKARLKAKEEAREAVEVIRRQNNVYRDWLFGRKEAEDYDNE